VKLTPLERRAAVALALVVGLRMFGLFLVLPVFAAQARAYPDAVPWLIGLALGVYGLGQALLQLPYGLLSDRIGRRETISIGLLLFALGGAVAAFASTLKAVVAGRALQGIGAVSGAALALAADLTRDPVRGKVMAILGMSIGASFVMALLLAAPLFAIGGLPFLFGATAVLALASLVVLWLAVPAPQRVAAPAAVGAGTLLGVLGDRRLLLLDLSVFVLHALLTAAFVALPTLLGDRLGLSLAQHWHFYLPVMIAAALSLGVFVGGRASTLTGLGWRQIAALALCATGLAVLAKGQGVMLLGFGGFAFFSGFTALEALMPTMVSRLAPVSRRGAALGAYASLQFLGAFVGGLVGGVLLGRLGEPGVLLGAAALAALWCGILLLLQRGLGRLSKR
jgi:MFS family permease